MTANPSTLSKRDSSTPRDSDRKQYKKKPRLSPYIYEQRHTCEESHQSGRLQKLCRAAQASYHPQRRTTSSPHSPDQLHITRERKTISGVSGNLGRTTKSLAFPAMVEHPPHLTVHNEEKRPQKHGSAGDEDSRIYADPQRRGLAETIKNLEAPEAAVTLKPSGPDGHPQRRVDKVK